MKHHKIKITYNNVYFWNKNSILSMLFWKHWPLEAVCFSESCVARDTNGFIAANCIMKAVYNAYKYGLTNHWGVLCSYWMNTSGVWTLHSWWKMGLPKKIKNSSRKNNLMFDQWLRQWLFHRCMDFFFFLLIFFFLSKCKNQFKSSDCADWSLQHQTVSSWTTSNLGRIVNMLPVKPIKFTTQTKYSLPHGW